jgi:putative addiction module component (TIGR02574 family)
MPARDPGAQYEQRRPPVPKLALDKIARYTAAIRKVWGAIMSTAVAEIEARIRSLSLADKTELIRTLIAELAGPADPDIERAWLEEAQRRHAEIVEGKVQPVRGERVFARLRSRLER